MMALDGLAKLTESLGEFQRVIGTILADDPNDEVSIVIRRFEEGAAGVFAAASFVAYKLGANTDWMKEAMSAKIDKHMQLDSDETEELIPESFIMESLKSAREDIPEGYEVQVVIESGEISVRLQDREGGVLEYPSRSGELEWAIEDAVWHAISIESGDMN